MVWAPWILAGRTLGCINPSAMQNLCVRPSWGISTDDLLPASTNQTFLTQATPLLLEIHGQHSREQRVSALRDARASHRCCSERAKAGWAPHSRTCINLLNQTLGYWEYRSLKRFDWVKSWTGQSGEQRHWAVLGTISIAPVTHQQHYFANTWISQYTIWSQVILDSSTNGPVKMACDILDTRKFSFSKNYATWCDHIKDRTVKTQRWALQWLVREVRQAFGANLYILQALRLSQNSAQRVYLLYKPFVLQLMESF